MYETFARFAALVTVAGAVIAGILCGGNTPAHAATPIRTVAAVTHHHHRHHHKPYHSAAYYAAHPCAPGHPPVSPDWGVCVDGQFRAS